MPELPDDFFYDLKSFERETPSSELPASFATPYHSFAFESSKRSNLHYLDEGATLMYAAGNYLHFVDLATMKQSYLPSVGGRGIGAVAVHPTKQYICVAEVGAEGAPPCGYVYEYPSLRLYRVLRNGTERAYTAVCFNGPGDKLATVGAFPDFMLTARQRSKGARWGRAGRPPPPQRGLVSGQPRAWRCRGRGAAPAAHPSSPISFCDGRCGTGGRSRRSCAQRRSRRRSSTSSSRRGRTGC